MDERSMKYAGILSRMIQAETVSHVDQPDKTKFREFHALLRELFPHLFAAAEFEEFDGSILLRWPGSGTGAPVLFMNHHDVVSVSGDWKYPPFSGEIAEGKVWGRGTLDTKGGLFGMLQAAEELAAEGFVPQTDIYFESACTEETTGKGADCISKVLQERGIRFSMVLDEGGMILYEPIGGAKGCFAMVGMGEKGTAELRFTARGNGGHSSTPEKDTPLVRLGRFMADVDSSNVFDVQVSPVIREMLRRLAPSMSGALKTVFAKPEAFDPVLKAVMPKTSATARALLQTTIAFTMAQGSSARNVIPAEASVIASMRVSHHQGYESSLTAIRKRAEKYGLETEVLMPPIESGLADFQSEQFALIGEAVAAAYPGVASVPYIMTGGSDARFMSRVCDNCFRFVPYLISHEQMESIHGVNENVDVSTLAPGVDCYKYLMRKVH